MQVLKDLPENYRRLFGLIPRGDDSPIPVADLAKRLNTDVRNVNDLVYKLVTRYGIPVCSYREPPKNGFFIPINDDQRVRGLVSQKEQVKSQAKKIRAIEEANFQIIERYEEKYPECKSVPFLIPFTQTELDIQLAE